MFILGFMIGLIAGTVICYERRRAASAALTTKVAEETKSVNKIRL